MKEKDQKEIMMKMSRHRRNERKAIKKFYDFFERDRNFEIKMRMNCNRSHNSGKLNCKVHVLFET